MRKISLACAFFLLTIYGYAQPDAKLIKKLDSIFSSFNKTTPGAAVTVIQNGKVLAKRSYGLASLEHKVPFKHNSVVRLGYSDGREFMVIAAVAYQGAYVNGWIRFHSNGNGEVTHLTVSHPRLMHHRFDKVK